jgi:GT2 family glycosyltransferase
MKGVEIIIPKENPLVSVIIPSLDGYRDGNVPKLIEAIKSQTFTDIEVLIVEGEKPCARAHNVGAQNASGKILVFIDDDITLGHNQIIANLINPLIKDNSIGITGASQLIPIHHNRFQNRCAKEFDRFQFPVVHKMTESDMATHATMAIRKEVFMQVGQENENLIYCDDPELRARIRKAGYKIVIVPHTWCYHPPPSNLTRFLKTAFQRGRGAAHDFWHYPHLIYETPPATATTFIPRRPFIYRVLRSMAHSIDAIINLKLIFLSVRISYALGYLFGLLGKK